MVVPTLMKSLIQMDDMKVKSKWMPAGEESQVLVFAIQFRLPAVVELLSNPVSAAHAVGKQLQTSIMKISTPTTCQRLKTNYIDASRFYCSWLLPQTQSSLPILCPLLTLSGHLIYSNFSASHLCQCFFPPLLDQSCSLYIRPLTVIIFANITQCVICQLCLWCPSLKTSFQF